MLLTCSTPSAIPFPAAPLSSARRATASAALPSGTRRLAAPAATFPLAGPSDAPTYRPMVVGRETEPRGTSIANSERSLISLRIRQVQLKAEEQLAELARAKLQINKQLIELEEAHMRRRLAYESESTYEDEPIYGHATAVPMSHPTSSFSERRSLDAHPHAAIPAPMSHGGQTTLPRETLSCWQRENEAQLRCSELEAQPHYTEHEICYEADFPSKQSDVPSYVHTVDRRHSFPVRQCSDSEIYCYISENEDYESEHVSDYVSPVCRGTVTGYLEPVSPSDGRTDAGPDYLKPVPPADDRTAANHVSHPLTTWNNECVASVDIVQDNECVIVHSVPSLLDRDPPDRADTATCDSVSSESEKVPVYVCHNSNRCGDDTYIEVVNPDATLEARDPAVHPNDGQTTTDAVSQPLPIFQQRCDADAHYERHDAAAVSEWDTSVPPIDGQPTAVLLSQRPLTPPFPERRIPDARHMHVNPDNVPERDTPVPSMDGQPTAVLLSQRPLTLPFPERRNLDARGERLDTGAVPEWDITVLQPDDHSTIILLSQQPLTTPYPERRSLDAELPTPVLVCRVPDTRYHADTHNVGRDVSTYELHVKTDAAFQWTTSSTSPSTSAAAAVLPQPADSVSVPPPAVQPTARDDSAQPCELPTGGALLPPLCVIPLRHLPAADTERGTSADVAPPTVASRTAPLLSAARHSPRRCLFPAASRQRGASTDTRVSPPAKTVRQPASLKSYEGRTPWHHTAATSSSRAKTAPRRPLVETWIHDGGSPSSSCRGHQPGHATRGPTGHPRPAPTTSPGTATPLKPTRRPTLVVDNHDDRRSVPRRPAAMKQRGDSTGHPRPTPATSAGTTTPLMPTWRRSLPRQPAATKQRGHSNGYMQPTTGASSDPAPQASRVRRRRPQRPAATQRGISTGRTQRVPVAPASKPATLVFTARVSSPCNRIPAALTQRGVSTTTARHPSTCIHHPPAATIQRGFSTAVTKAGDLQPMSATLPHHSAAELARRSLAVSRVVDGGSLPSSSDRDHPGRRGREQWRPIGLRHPSGPAATPVAATATPVATTVTPTAGRAGNHRRSPQTTVQTSVWPSSDARRCYCDARRLHRDARCGSSR
ncbi:hypothetical protein JYU34_018325 [Plutella xylostella]|uniref:Uncharacterized protein n=1 Tax=Plutella xylostella TaxID=51655 RepID=A0ABQ7Q0B3_PLUXY|nr:hypothetical protein JYU34_018325 [Plutella xylostella]